MSSLPPVHAVSVVRCPRCNARKFTGATCKSPRCFRAPVYVPQTDGVVDLDPKFAQHDAEVHVTARPKYASDANGNGSSVVDREDE